MNRFYLTAIFFCGLILNLYPFSTRSSVSFSHISVREGLSQNTVLDICQDSAGDMWFATMDGLTRYDGYSSRIYRHTHEDTTTIAHNHVTAILRDARNRMWYGSKEGLSLYDAEKDHFVNFPQEEELSGKEIRCIIDANDSTLLIGINNRVLVFDTEKGEVRQSLVSDKSADLTAIVFLKRDDSVFVGTMSGLYVYDSCQKILRPYHDAFRKRRIQSLLLQKKDLLWVGTEGVGLYRVDLNTGEIRHFLADEKDPGSLSSDYIRSLAVDDHQQLWVGTFRGLNLFDEQKSAFIRITHEPFRKGSLSQNSIRALYKDNQDGMWIGTYFGGVDYYHPLKNRFRTISQTPEDNSLNDNNISCMIEDSRGDMWVATMDKGLNRWDHQTGLFRVFPTILSKTHNIKSLYLDEKRQILYAGAHAGGLSSVNLSDNRIRTYLPGNSDIKDENIYAILPLEANTLLLGALNGLVLFDQEKQAFKRPEGTEGCNRITYLLQDSRGNIRIGMDSGLASYRYSDGHFEPEPAALEDSLKGIRINSLHEATDGSIWVASTEGLWRMHDNRITRFTTREGLSNNVIYGVLEDTFGRLWLSSNNGLSCLNPSTGKVKNYTDEEGIESSQFNMFSFCKRRSGEMCFGGNLGITVFHPDRMQDNPYLPQPRIRELKLFNKIVRPGDETGILEKDLSHTDQITLKASQNVFSLGFIVSNYVGGTHNNFTYTLEGFDKEWYTIKDYNFVSYSNLPAGDYIFKVKVSNNDNYQNEQPAVLHITVLPVWYKTWWAILFFIVAAILILVLILRYFLIQRNLKDEIRLQQLEKEKAEELNQMKLRFFINISHELRTPLSLIIDPIQDIIRSTADKRTRMQLDYAQRNAMKLLRLVNQLLDYRKAEMGVLTLKVAALEIHPVLKDCFESYEKLARNKEIRYSFVSGIEDKLCLVDVNYLELIVNNFLSNAFKYTPEGGTIELEAFLENDSLVITVKDTGIGIREEERAMVFDRFYQVDSEKTGSGIGLSLVKKLVDLHHGLVTVNSEPGIGSLFRVQLPQRKEDYAPAEWAKEVRISESAVPANNSGMEFLLLNEEASAPREKGGTGKKGRLMIVEDNDEIREYLKDSLSPFFEMYEASNGQEAVTALQTQEIDVVLSDVMMPVMDGLKMCTRLKNNIQTSHIPIILLSAKAEECFQIDAFRAGADDYIPKPFSTPLLIGKIQNQIRNRQRVVDHLSRNIQIDPQNISCSVQDEEFLSKARSIVESHIADVDFSTDEFSRKMHMSRSNLHLKLKAVTGESAIEYIRKIRFSRACELLEEGRHNVGEISTMVGFSSQSYFSATFKKYLGCLPSEYVRKKRMLFNE